MAKTAAQLVPLKTQLAQNMALFRFADATTDFSGAIAYQDWAYDNSGAANLLANGTTGASPVSLTGPALPTTQVSVPTNLTATVNNAAASGLSRYSIQQWYWVTFYDSSNRESQPMVVLATIPLGTTTGSVTFNFTWPAGAAGAAIYKAVSGSGCYRVSVGNLVGTITDTGSLYSTWTSGSGNTSTYATGAGVNWFANCNPAPSSSSVAPAMSTTFCNVTTPTTGGAFRSSAYGYAVSAYNALGETPITAETDAQITGSPLISGAMTNPTLTAATTSGTLPAGKYYYKVTAYTAQPNINGFTPGQGGGMSETLPSAEVNTTLAANGQITVSWAQTTNATGYIVYRSNDLVNPTATTTSTATTGGTIAASTTFFYVVTATNANGETMASNEVSQATGAGTATNTITVNWTKVPNAYGYRVYRGTATGAENTLIGTIPNGGTLTFVDTGTAGSAASLPVSNTATGVGLETYILAVAGNTSTSWIDSGLNPNNQNSGFTPPTTYNGQYGPASISLNWNASTGSPVGYNLYRNTYGNVVANATTSNYYQTTAPTVTFNDTNTAPVGTKAPVQANLTSVQNIMTVGRYLQPPAGLPNSATTVLTKVGFTFAGVAGKQYRFFLWDQSTQSWRWNSGNFTAPSSAQLYYEIQPNLTMSGWVTDNLYLGVQGMDGASFVTWQPNLRATSGDAPNTVQADNGTWIATGSNFNMSSGSGWTLGNATSQGINSPVQVLNETTTGSLPMKVVFRTFSSGANINGTKGTFLGGARWPQYALSPNTSYTAAPVKSIVPSWSVATPTTPLSNQFYSNRWATVEVSTDGGTTFAALTNNTRFVFPSAATQLQFRYTLPQNSCAMSFDRRIMTGLPATDASFVGAFNYSFLTDTNNPGFYYNAQSNNNDAFLASNGNFRLGTNFSQYQYNFWSVQGFSVDVDMTTTGSFFGSGNFGLRFRNDGSNSSYGGYYAYIDNTGTCGLIKQTYAFLASQTTLASVTNATPALNNLPYTLRVIAVGTHIMVFVNGRLVIDYTDAAATGNYLTGLNVGLSGSNNHNINSFQATALTSTYLTNSPPWELEYVSAYLET
jgi:hypothetical protein